MPSLHTPPIVALLITVGIIVFLFRRDLRQKPNVTSALWIPWIWVFINMSRFVTAWLDMAGIHVGGSSVQDGSPVDALGTLVLIIAAYRVLSRRGFRFAEFTRQNQWLVIFFIWCFLAALWSDFPFVALKRWFKFIGEPFVVLVLFAEPDLETAVTVLMKRLAYVIVPVSVLFIKYYPEYGRGFSDWNGMAFNMGIAPGKNQLGLDCLILGFFFVWYGLKVWQQEKSKLRRDELIFCAFFLFMTWWLMDQAQSSTSLVACIIGIALMLALGWPAIRKEHVGTYIILTIVFLGLAEYFFNISDLVLEILGKDRTLTDRTKVWQDCLDIPINPIIGVGFDSFFLGDRQATLNSKWVTWAPSEAHNGYLETYLNLGMVGLFLLLLLFWATFWKARRELLTNFHFGRFRVAFLVALVVYDWTETSFKALNPMWFVFFIITLDYPKPESETVLELAETQLEVLPPDQIHGLKFVSMR